ncbi:MAG: DUF192 domain-containing protein, partial [Saprospiraceae bacterium]
MNKNYEHRRLNPANKHSFILGQNNCTGGICHRFFLFKESDGFAGFYLNFAATFFFRGQGRWLRTLLSSRHLMAKSVISKSTQSLARKKKRPAKNRKQQIIIGLMIVALAAMFLPNLLPSFRSGKSARNFTPTNKGTMPEPKFTKEGTLSFISSETGEAIRTIDIEKAGDDMERQFGLMYRKSMPDTQGMLFIFDKAGKQSFWMRNTYISLDIMFVDAENRILNIHQNTKPLSDTSLPSTGDAQFVV